MPRPWSIVDFILVILGGFLGAGVFAVVGALAVGEEIVLVLALGGQYLGSLGVFWLLARGRDEPDVGFSVKGGDIRYLALGLLAQVVLALAFFPLAELLIPEGDSAQQIGELISALETTAARVGAVLVAAVIAPVTEEIIFRGVLLKALGQRSRRTVLVVTALVFALFHLLGLDPSQFFAAAAIVLPQLFAVGLVLGWVTLRSGRLGPAIFLHSGFNLLAAIALLIPPELLETVTP